MKDLIERQAAIDALADMHCKSDEDGYVWIIRSDAWARIDALPSAQPEKRMEERAETHACDLIDREAAVDAIYHHLPSVSRTRARTMLHEVPSAQPERKTGRWIDKKCSRCGCRSMLGLCIENFCPNCGARMTEEDV